MAMTLGNIAVNKGAIEIPAGDKPAPRVGAHSYGNALIDFLEKRVEEIFFCGRYASSWFFRRRCRTIQGYSSVKGETSQCSGFVVSTLGLFPGNFSNRCNRVEQQQAISGSRVAAAKHYLNAYRKAQELGLSPAVIAFTHRCVVEACRGTMPLRAVAPQGPRPWQMAVQSWAGLTSWQQRIELLGELFEAASSPEGEGDLTPLYTWLENELKVIARWLPLEGEGPQELGTLLRSYGDIEATLPSMWAYYREHILQLHPPFVESSLWSGFLSAESHPLGMRRYLRGVGMLHFYLIKHRASYESLLWQAKELVSNSSGREAAAFPSWQELVSWAVGQIERLKDVAHVDRQALKLQLMVVRGDLGAGSGLSLADVEAYLAAVPTPEIKSLGVLSNFVSGALRFAKAAELVSLRKVEMAIIAKIADASHLTSRDLARLWYLANKEDAVDLAWRIATIAQRRQILGDYAERLWQISGEYRRAYPCTAPDELAFHACVSGFSPEEITLVQGLFLVGSALPFLASGPLQLKLRRKKLLPRHSRFVQGLVAIITPLLHPMWRGREWQASAAQEEYPFAAEPGSSNWRLLLGELVHLYGCAAWEWKLSHILALAADLVPRQRHSWKDFYSELFNGSQRIAASWQRSLSAEQRQAWHQFLQLASSISDEAAARTMFRFLCRLATTMYPHHQQALASLQEMGAPLEYIWDFECWLLSPAYTKFRKEKGLSHEQPIPEYLHESAAIS
jgi:hypothetical protein